MSFLILEISSVHYRFLEFFLKNMERTHALVRRYTCPDEKAFFPDALPTVHLPLVDYPQRIVPNNINKNDKVMVGNSLPRFVL